MSFVRRAAKKAVRILRKARNRNFDGTRYCTALRHDHRAAVDVPAGTHFLRMRLSCEDNCPTREVLVTGKGVIGGKAVLSLHSGWHSYFVPLCGPLHTQLRIGRNGEGRSGEQLGVSLASMAVVDPMQRSREDAPEPPRMSLSCEDGPAAATAHEIHRDDRYLESVEKSWDYYGRLDPMFYILTDESKRNRGWRVDEFFQIGADEVSNALDWVDSRGTPARRGVALDFGCGVGRLTQGMARHFETVHGVDIAPSMVDAARRLNAHGDRVAYHHSSSETLPFPDGMFDFIYTNIVLQHIRPQYIRNYLDQFVRVLAPGGVLVFQLPSAPRWDWQGIKLRLLPEHKWHPSENGQFTATMEFYWIRRWSVLRHFGRHPVNVEDVRKDFSAPAISYKYFIRKQAAQPQPRRLSHAA